MWSYCREIPDLPISKILAGTGDGPLPLVELIRDDWNSGTKLQLNSDTARTITAKAGNRPISAICICGPSRQGKSFILNYMMRCLEALEKEEDDWMDWYDRDKPLQGFKRRNGSQPERAGIWVWSRPFIVKSDDDKEVAVLLVDTQGTYDEFTTNKDMSAIVGLSLLTSSVMIFNLFTNLQEDVLTSLSTYGLLAMENVKDDTPPFQKLIFLIRDWNNPGEYKYGAKDGKKFLDDKLETKHCQAEEAKRIRESLKKCFQNYECFLMPRIGEKALLPTFTGAISELAKNFATKMEEFISHLISDSLVIKKVLGNEVTAAELVGCLENYIEVFNSNETPSAKSIWEATSDVHNGHIFRKACRNFQELVRKKLRGNNYMQADGLNTALEGGRKQAQEVWKKARKFGGRKKIQQYQDNLEELLEKETMEYKRQNEEKRTKYLMVVFSDAQTTFEKVLTDYTPFNDEEDDTTSVEFYEENVIRRSIDIARNVAILELREKLENESEEMVTTKVETLTSILEDGLIPAHHNRNAVRRANAEKKMASIIDELVEKMEVQLKDYHQDNLFPEEGEMEEHHNNLKAKTLKLWRKERKPGKKEFQEEFEEKLERALGYISETKATEHKLHLQECQLKGKQSVLEVTENYDEELTDVGENVETEEELEQAHENRMNETLEEFASSSNPYPEDHPLHQQLQEKLETELNDVFERVKREVLVTQQKMQVSYPEDAQIRLQHYEEEMKGILRPSDADRNVELERLQNLHTTTSSLRHICEKIRCEEAEYQKRQESLYAEVVSTSMQFYENTFQAIFDSVGFLSGEHLKSEHERVKQGILNEIDFQPTAAANFKNLEFLLEEKFEDIEKENRVKWKDAEAKAKFTVYKSKNKYLSAMRTEMGLAEKKVGDIARQMLEKNCPARGNPTFVDAQKLKLEKWIRNIQEKINVQIIELARELAKDGRAGI